MDRLPPHSTETEQAVLGCILLSPLESLDHCAALNIQPEAFYELRNRSIYQAMVRLCMGAKRIDVITVCENLREQKQLQEVGGQAYVSELADKAAPAALGEYLDILIKKAVSRQAIALCTETASIAFEQTPDSWLANFRERVIELRTSRNVLARPIGELIRPQDGDPSILFQNRYMCECGGMLINGPTGMGKSSFAMQALALWSNALAFFGIQPARKLTAVLIQAENDDGDLAEMRDGMCTGLDFNQDQRSTFFNNVHVVTSTGAVGRRFINEVVQPILIQHKPNILAIDPANSFIGGDTKEQRDVSAFLRSWLNPMLYAYRCMAMIVHHTNKPKMGTEKPNWRNGEWAYAGSGSAEWANWARAILSIQDTGTHGIYRLHAAKRGKRLHWKDHTGTTVTERLIGHSPDPGLIYWRDAKEAEIEVETGFHNKARSLIPFIQAKPLSTTEWQKVVRAESNIPRATFFRCMDWLESENLISKFDDKWRPHNFKNHDD